MSIIRKGFLLRSITILVGLMIGGTFFVSPSAYAADGSGTNTVTPTSTNVSTTGNTFTFTFTAAETMDSGGISITAPSGWSMAQGTNGSVGYTTVSTTGMIATVKNNADSLTVPAAWTKNKCGSIALDSTVKHEGTSSVRCGNFNAAVGNSWYIKPATAENWSGYTRAGFWINSSKAIPAGALTFSFDNANNLGSPIENISIPAIAMGTWTYVTVDFASATTTRTSVASYGWRSASNTFNGANINIDDLLIGPGVPTFPGSGVVNIRTLSLASGQTITTTYGSGGGTSGVTAPATAGTYIATTTSRISDSGTLTNIASHPTLTAKYPMPTLTSISPTSATVNGSGFTMDATGTNFVTGQTALQFNGSARTTTVDSTTALHATIPASDLTSIGTFNITVVNPTPGGGSSIAQTFTVNKATTSIAVSSSASTSTYGSTVTFTATTTPASGGPATGTVSFKNGTTTLGTGTLINNIATFSTSSLNVVGSPYSITAIYGGDGNFLGSTSSAITQTITPKVLTVTGMAATNKTYDATTTVTLSGGALVGVVGSDVVSINTRTGFFADKNVGTGKTITVTGVALSGADAANYTVANPTGITANITARTLTISATASNKTYDATTTASIALFDDRIAGDAFTSTSSSATFADKNVGTGKTVTVSGISISGTDATNYAANNTTTAAANIMARSLTVTAQTNTKVYDQTTTASSTPTITSGALQGGDTASFTESYDTKNVGIGKTLTPVGTVTDGNSGNNYVVTLVNDTTGSITAKNITVTGITGVNKVYDQTMTASVTGGALSGVIAGDVVSLNNASTSATFADKNVGTGKTITVTGVALSGADAANYTVTNPTGITANITPKNLIVTGMTGVDRVYDRTVAASVTGGALSGVISPDDVTLNTASTSASFADKNVGTGKTITVTGVALSGIDVANYAASATATTSASITAKGLTVTGITANDKNYDGNQTATLNIGSAVLSGVISGDDTILNTSGAAGSFDTPNAGLNKPVTISGLIVTGVDAGNYLLAQPTTTASITNPTPTITTFSPTSASAEGSNFTLTINGSNFIASTTVMFNGSQKTVTLVSANQLTIPILASDIATEGTSTITVTNPAPGGGTATSTNFVVILRATKMVIAGTPYSGTVDAPVTITIQAQKPGGGVDTTFNNTVTLLLNSSTTYATSSQSHIVTIASGVGTYSLTDHAIETVSLSLLDTASTSLDVTSTGTAAFAAGAVTKFTFGPITDTPQDTRLKIDVVRQDQFNNYVMAGVTNVYFYASPTTTANNFYNAPTGGTQTNLVAIADGSASSSIWFGGAPLGTLGTYTITASDNATSSDGAVGIADVSTTTTVTPVATQLAIINPTDGTVDAPITVNVEARDDNNNLVTSYNGSATLVVSGHATLDSSGTITFADGRATTTLHDTVAPETVTISIVASSTALRSSSVQDVLVGVGVLSQFTLTDPGDAVAGTLVGYTATRKDQYGNLITAGTLSASLLVSPTTTPGVFYAANSTSSAQLTALQFDNGSATKQFWYYNETVGSYQLTVQNASAVGNDMIAISPAVVAKLTMNDLVSTNPGSRLEYTIVRKDRFNNLVTSGSLPVYMYASPTSSSTAFYDAASAGNAVTSVTIADTQSSANVWYYETQVGSYTITASDNATTPDGSTGLLDATDQVNVQVATGTRFVFASVVPQSLAAGSSSVVTIEVRDDFGNLDTSYQNDVTLVTGVSSVSGPGLTAGNALIDIVNGIGSITLTDNIAETVNLALTDSRGTGLNVSDTSSIAWHPGPTAQFTLSDPGDIVAGNRIGYMVNRKDHYGNYVTAGSDTVYLYSDSVGAHKAFYTSSTTTSTAQFVTITSGATSTQFWYSDLTAGTYTITASDNATTPDGATGIIDATDQLIVTAAPIVATRFVIIDPQDVAVNQNTVVVIQTQDDAGALDNKQQGTIVLVLSTSSAVTIPGTVNKEVTVNINNGVGTVTMTDPVIETISLSLRLPTGSTSTLSVASTQDVAFLAATPASVGAGGSGIYYVPPQPVAIFTGRAYPGAKIILFARTAAGDIPIKQDIKVAADGTFTVDFSGALKGLEAFGLSILDENGRVAQTKIYDMNKITAVTAEKNLYIAPTAGIIQRTVTIGNNVGITGFAAPGSVVKAEVDGQPVDAQVQVGKDGTYRLLINTKDLAFGGHVVRTKQIDKNGIESGFSTSKVFTVSKTLNTRADLNNNGKLDIGDWSIFLTSFGSANPDVRKQADLNGDGKVDISDFSIFIRSSVGR